jgi:glutamate/tyrosine decarboxylase-like PLP-dependent enzyme
LRRQVLLAWQLRDGLRSDGWTLMNDTPLPVVCFADDSDDSDDSDDGPDLVAEAVNQSGEARIFTVRLGERLVLRACVTNYATCAEDIDLLIKLLDRAREDVRSRRFDDPSSTVPATDRLLRSAPR